MSVAIDFLNVFYLHEPVDNFTAQLFKLIAKADHENLEWLQAGYPQHVKLYKWWMSTPERPTPEVVREKVRELWGQE